MGPSVQVGGSGHMEPPSLQVDFLLASDNVSPDVYRSASPFLELRFSLKP